MYGAPEYGGNHDLVGWRTTGFEGDVQPRGWTRAEVEHPVPDPAPALPPPPGAEPAAALGSAELLHGVLARTEGRYRELRRVVGNLTSPTGDAAAGMAAIAEAAAALVEKARR
jgi:hypothetical protein